MEPKTIRQNLVAQSSLIIAAPRQVVWKCLTEPDLIKRYMMGATVQTDWTKGSPITWSGEWKGKQFQDKGTIVDAEPYQLLQYTHFSPLSGMEDKKENYHTVTFVLNEEDEGTFVSVTQDNNDSPEAVAHSENNWHAILEGLKKVVEETLKKE